MSLENMGKPLGVAGLPAHSFVIALLQVELAGGCTPAQTGGLDP